MDTATYHVPAIQPSQELTMKTQLNANDTANTYFCEAIAAIDGRFGEGYAEAHPEWVGAVIEATSHTLNTREMTASQALHTQAITSSLNRIAETLDSLLKRGW